MDDAFGMRGRQRRRQLPRHRQDGVERRLLPLDDDREVFTFDVLHHEERAAVVLDHVVDDGDVGMRDARGRTRFVKNPRAQLGGGRRRDEAFQRDLPVQPRVVAEKHVAHAADAEPIEDHVRPDAIADVDVENVLPFRGRGRRGAVERA